VTSFKPKTYTFDDFIYTGTKNETGSQGEIIKPSFKAQLDNIPDELKEYDQWVVWSLIQKEGKEKVTKLPTRKVSGKEIKNASLSYPMSYSKARSIYEADKELFAGVGFVFTKDDPFVFIDLDGVSPGDERNKYAGAGTFVEFSQSGKGLHIICRGSVTKAHKPISGDVEIYANNRFCALTGILAGQKSLDVTDQQELIDELIESYPHENSGAPRQESTGYQLPEVIPEGSRNDTMWAFACSLANKNIQSQTMMRRLLDTNQELCQPPLEESEVSEMLSRAQDLVERSRDERYEEAEDVDLLNRYALITTNEKFFDLEKKLVCTKGAVDAAHLCTHPGGQNNPPKATTAIAQSHGLLKCNGLVWFPQPYGSDQLFVDDMGLRYANTWRGFTVSPREGDVEPWLSHLNFLFPSAEHQRNVKEWLAFMLQHPDLKCNWQLIISGDEGAGKDALFTPISQILGSAASVIGNKDVRGDFDDGLVGSKFITFSEARLIRDDAMEYLKRISASENTNLMMLNPKKQEKVWQHNLWAIAVITNHADAVKLSPTERRFYILSTDDRIMTEKQKHEYFKDWLQDTESQAALLHYLLGVNLDSFDPDTLPERTEYMMEMIEATDNDMESLLKDWNTLNVNSFAFEVTHPEWIKSDLLEHNVKFTMASIKKWLKKNGWEKPEHRPVKKIKGKTFAKSTMFFVKKDEKLVTQNAADVYDSIVTAEEQMLEAQQEHYRNTKTA